VEQLSFDWSPGGPPVVGQAPRGRAVQVLLRLADGRGLTIPRTVDAAGTFRLGAEDVPPRATWAWTDVVAVRVVLPTADGHQIIAQTEDFEAPPAPARRPVYLPIAYAKGRGAATAALGKSAGTGSEDQIVVPAPRSAARAHALDAAATWRRAVEWLDPWGEVKLGRRPIQPIGGWRPDPGAGGVDWHATYGMAAPKSE
jgi:hypothetical protein